MMEADTRVEDFLDDKLQTPADLAHIDTLLSAVEFQRSQLQSQLDDATRALDEARRVAADRSAALAAQIAEFDKLQKGIDVRLRIVSASDAPDAAVRRLERPLKQLESVELAYKYLMLLQDVEGLREEARKCLPGDPRKALEPYGRLKELALRLKKLQEEADGAAVFLVSHVETAVDRLWEEMKGIMRTELEKVLEKRKWPAQVSPESEIDEEWLQCFEKLLDLQLPEILHAASTPKPEVVTLLAMDVMTDIFVKEFRFHFLSDKPTSAPQVIGQHCFPWVLNLLEKWEDFFRDNFSPLLAAKFADTPAARKMVYMDPVCAFISSLLPVIREKVTRTLEQTQGDTAFLSSLLSQLMTFDDQLRSSYAYDGGLDSEEWGGLTAEVLATHFRTWLEAEKIYALDRYHEIMATQDCRQIDYDFAGPGKTKPTFGAVRVTDLLRSITQQYCRVRKFGHKLRFLIDIQLTILDEYHDALRGSLEAYLSLTSTVGRAFGVSKEQLAALEGTGALEALCKVYGSADHIVNTLREWSNDEFFVALWQELQDRAKAVSKNNSSSGAGHKKRESLGVGISYDQIKDRTSAAVGSDDEEGVLFDETIAAYSQRRKRAEEFLADALVDSHKKAFKAYLHRPNWSTVAEDGEFPLHVVLWVTVINP
mgnify:CR=1 FL=1